MSKFYELLHDIPTPFNMVVLIILIISVTSVITAIAKQVRKHLGLRHELEFKRELLDRGLSIDEIERVMRVSTPSSSHEDN